MTKDEMKDRISMALKDPILQQGFEIFCKNLSDLEKENVELKAQIEGKENEFQYFSNSFKIKISNLKVQIEKMKKVNAEQEEQISTKNIQIKELQEQRDYWKESAFDWRHKFFEKRSTKRLVKKSKQLAKARDLILNLYNAGRDVLMCRNEELAYTRLDNAINDKRIEQFLKEIEE